MFKPSKCKLKPFYHNQGSSMPSLKHPKWIKKKQVAQLCLTPHLVVTSWLSLKFVGLFHVSMFLWILKIHVAFDVLCLCVYIYIYIYLKKIQDFQIFPKKREKFSNEKSLWTRGIELLSHLKKNLWTRGIGLPSDIFKKWPIFLFKRFQDSLKSFFQNDTRGSLGQNFF